MSGRLKDKVAVVLGAGSSGPGWGNGKAAAVLFAREGAKIFAVDLRREAAKRPGRLSRLKVAMRLASRLMCLKVKT
jgi:NAD(P)-dependent dehydrogenase (short-subunit alcohol dehydrogenase family)